MSDERPAVDDERADAGAERHAGHERRDNAEKRAEARLHDEREDPGREAHRGRKGEIDLADRDDEHQRHDQAERDRQGDEDRIVDRPMQEHRRARGHEDRDHHDEHGERAERRAVAVDEAPERRSRADARPASRAPSMGSSEAVTTEPPACGRARPEFDPLRMGEPLHKAIRRSAEPTSSLVACSATVPRSITTKRSAMSKT